jgi:hypothetical protein
MKRCRNGTKCNGGVSESNEGGKNELLIPLPSGFIDVILRTK